MSRLSVVMTGSVVLQQIKSLGNHCHILEPVVDNALDDAMMLAARIARPAARSAPVRNLTQVSSEARRYSFAHAADDIIGEDQMDRQGCGEGNVGGRGPGVFLLPLLACLLVASPPCCACAAWSCSHDSGAVGGVWSVRVFPLLRFF